MPTKHRDRHGDCRAGHENQNTSRIGAALCIDVCLEDNRHHNRDGHKDHHQWACCTCPLGCHPVAWEVPWDDVEKPRHRACTRKPQNRNRRDVVKRPEALAIKLIRQIRKRTAIGGFMRLECLRRNQHCCHKAAGNEVNAHHQRRPNEQLLCAANTPRRHFLGVAFIARNKRHHSNARLEP